MRSLLELIDRNQMLNLITALNRKPDIVYFLYQEDTEELLNNEVVRKYLTCPYQNVRYTPETLEETLKSLQGDEIEVDVHGGKDFAIALVSGIAASMGFTLVYPGFTTATMYISGPKGFVQEKLEIPKLRVHEIIGLYGASVRNLKEAVFEGEKRNAVYACEEARRDHPSRWNSFCKMMGTLSRKHPGESVWTASESVHTEYRSIFHTLACVFRRCEVSGSHLILELADPEYLILVTDSGVSFEYETFYQMEDSGLFDDIDLRVNIDWNGGAFERSDPNSELDVMASLNGRLISVSCKSGKYDQQAIYEVKANAVKFGGDLAVPILCNDYPQNRAELVRKAEALGVLIIEYEDMRAGRCAELIWNWMKNH